MNRTSIEWCRTYAANASFEEGFSINPVRFRPNGSDRRLTMCQKVSPGCAHCYAESISRRFWPKDGAGPFPGYTARGVEAGEFVLDEKTLLSVLNRKQPARIFWGDMTDLFQESIPDAFLDKCFAVAALTPHLTHMFLTKRPDRMLEDLPTQQLRIGRVATAIARAWIDAHPNTWSQLFDRSPVAAKITADGVELRVTDFRWPLANVWLGVSVENQKAADERIPLLLMTPAAVRFLSVEPLLGPVNIAEWTVSDAGRVCRRELGGRDLPNVDWVICGGESGPGARPMHPDWARALRDQCQAAGVPFFFKQWGEWSPTRRHEDGSIRLTVPWEDVPPSILQRPDCAFGQNDDLMFRVGKKAAGRLLDGREWNQFPGSAEDARLAQGGVLGVGELKPETAAAVRDGAVEGLPALEGAQAVAALGEPADQGLGIAGAEAADRADQRLQVGLEEVHHPALAVPARRRRSTHEEAHVDPHAEIVGGRRG